MNPYPFICGKAFRSLAGVVIEHGEFKRQLFGNPQILFIRTDEISDIQKYLDVLEGFKWRVVSHQGDSPFESRHLALLDDDRILSWHAVNPKVVHSKLRPIPIGVANPEWPHGDIDALLYRMRNPLPKTRLVSAMYNPSTNPKDRLECVESTGLYPETGLSFPDYLSVLSSSWFTYSPPGNGVDCHRHWESLLMGCVPVVIDSPAVDYEIPMLRVKEWPNPDRLSKELHLNLMKVFMPDDLLFPNFISEYAPQLRLLE